MKARFCADREQCDIGYRRRRSWRFLVHVHGRLVFISLHCKPSSHRLSISLSLSLSLSFAFALSVCSVDSRRRRLCIADASRYSVSFPSEISKDTLIIVSSSIVLPTAPSYLNAGARAQGLHPAAFLEHRKLAPRICLQFTRIARSPPNHPTIIIGIIQYTRG